jgi:cold shock CspA family protein
MPDCCQVRLLLMGGETEMSIATTLTNSGGSEYRTGSVTKFESPAADWGQITPDGTSRSVFFDRASLAHASDFDLLALGQRVRFEEESDPVNDTHAVRVSPMHASPYTDFSRNSGR